MAASACQVQLPPTNLVTAPRSASHSTSRGSCRSGRPDRHHDFRSLIVRRTAHHDHVASHHENPDRRARRTSLSTPAGWGFTVGIVPGTTKDTPAEGTRERRRRLTAREVERVAIDLFAERGFDAVTVDEIASAAHISRRTFFRYYPNKEDVVLAAGEKQLDALKQGLASRPSSESALEAIRNAFIGMADRFELGRDEYLRRWGIVTACPALGARAYGAQWEWDETISDFVAARLGVDASQDLRPRLIGGTVMGALRAAIAAWILGDSRELTVLLNETFDMLGQGLDALIQETPADG